MEGHRFSSLVVPRYSGGGTQLISLWKDSDGYIRRKKVKLSVVAEIWVQDKGQCVSVGSLLRWSVFHRVASNNPCVCFEFPRACAGVYFE